MTADHTRPPEVSGRSGRATLPPIPNDYDRLERLYQIQTVLAQPTSLEQACDALLATVAGSLRVRTAVLLDTTQELQQALTWAAAGIAPAALDEAREHARERLGYLAPGGLVSANLVSRTAVLPGGVAVPVVVPRHFVTLPLVVRGRVIGVFQLEGALEFEERDLLFINVVVNQLAVALDRHHVQIELEASRSELLRANRRLEELQVIAGAALEGATLDESLAAVLAAMHSIFATDAAAVLLVSADGRTLRRRASIGLKDAGDMEVLIGAGAEGRIAASGAPMFYDDLDELDDLGPALRANGIRSLLGAPLRARHQVTGVVHVASRDHRDFTYDELQLLELVADRVGTIIDNAALYEQALAAVRSRDRVLGVVSHDLRNPLSTIQMCTDMLGTDDPRVIKPVSMINRSIDVMTRLISDLGDLGSIEAGRLSIDTRSEDALALVRDAIEGVQEIAAEKYLHLAVRPPARDLVVACDRIRVIQVVTNLLTNAIKFTPQGGSITIAAEEAGAGRARFSVQDTGSGIPEADLPKVFDRYWQARDTSHLGTGLGLAITKGIVEAHGGSVSVESRVDHGTTFSFTLPLAGDGVAGDRVGAQQTVAPRTGARVLVVDDEPNALAALGSLLYDAGFVVETAADGVQALFKAREFAPDILIVDVEMPGLRGPDLVLAVRDDRSDLPVILMTGHGDDVVASATAELRASHVAKPVAIDELVFAIHRALDEER